MLRLTALALALLGCAHPPPAPGPAPAPARVPPRPNPVAHPQATPARPGCLPERMHGPLLARRGAWRLHRSVSGDWLLLEHVGLLLRIDEPAVATLRARIDSWTVVDGPVHGFGGPALCDSTVHPRQGACLMASILPGTDPFLVAERLDRAHGAEGAAACYGVTIHVEPMAQAF